jgi:signal transduction histidine kinase
MLMLAITLTWLAPAPTRPWLLSMGVVAWLAGHFRPQPSEGQRLRELKARTQDEVIRRATLEVEGLKTADLLRQLKKVDSLQQCLEGLFQALQANFSASACAFYRGGLLVAARGTAPRLLPAVARDAWRAGRACQADGQAAVPAEAGVLWLHAPAPLSAEQLDLLDSLAGPAALGLGLWTRQQNLQHWSERLILLVESARALIGSQDPSRVGQLIEALVCRCLPHRLGLICGLEGQIQIERCWPEEVRVDWSSLDPAQQGAFQNESLVGGLANWLAAPIQFEGGAPGLLLIGQEKGQEFPPEASVLLNMIAALAAGAMAQAHLYADLKLTHQELKDSQARLLDSAKLAAIGQLAAGMAHELNTPLGAIRLSLEGAQNFLQSKPERARQRLETAALGLSQCQHIVESLLLYCRQQPLERKLLNLNEVVAETILLIRGEFQQNGVELRVELQGSAPMQGNPGQLRQLVTNLLMNARDATLACPNPSVAITSQLKDSRIFLSVSDNGAGMSAEVLARACEPFFTTKPVGRGTGLGLSVSHEIVQQHGGCLKLDSQPGQGCRVQVEFPSP